MAGKAQLRPRVALVTGAGGFIGRVLVQRLVDQGWRVRALLLPGEDTQPLEAHGSSVEIRRGDVTDPASLRGLADGVSHVFHLAARVTDWGSLEAYRGVTVDGTQNLLEACRGAEVQRFVYFSSFTALGFTRDTAGLDEEAPCILTGIPYSDTKVEAEKLTRRLAPELGMAWTIVRPSNVIGPGSVWATDILGALRQGRMLLVDGGRAPTAFVHVGNLVDGALLAATADVAENRTYHFRDDYPLTWGEYIRQLADWVGGGPRGSVPVRAAYWLGAGAERALTPLGKRPAVTRLAAAILGRNHEVSNGRARQELGWRSRVSQEQMLQELRRWYDDEYARRRSRRRAPRVYITGGSKGIGLAIAREYLRQGAHVVLFARSAPGLDAARASLEHASAGRAQIAAYCMDVTDEASVEAVAAQAVTEQGPPDVLVNCAGIIASDRFERIPTEQYEAVLRTNVLGPVHTVRALLPALRRRRGHVVNVASMAGLVGMWGYTAYASSKHALVGFSESLRAELVADGVGVSVVCPPEVPTDMVTDEAKTLPRAARVVKHMAGIVSPETVARATVRGVARRQFLIVPGLMAKAVYATHSLSLGNLSRWSADVIFSLVSRL